MIRLCSGITLNHSFGSRRDKILDILLWPHMTRIVLYLHGDVFGGLDSLPTTTKNIEADLPAKANCPTSLRDTSMYLKAACSDIAVPRQRGGPRLDRCPSSVQQRPVAGTRLQPSSPNACLPGSVDPGRPREQQQQDSLERVLHLHSDLVQASRQPGSSMVYR